MDFMGQGLVSSPYPNPNGSSPFRNSGSGTSDGQTI